MRKGKLNDPELARAYKQAGARAVKEINRKAKTGPFDPEHQKRAAAASMARPDAREIRSKAGKKGGTNRKKNIAIQPDKKYVFSYKGKEVLSVFNCSSGTQVLEALQAFVAIPKMVRVTNLLKGTRKMAYGWTCKEIV